MATHLLASSRERIARSPCEHGGLWARAWFSRRLFPRHAPMATMAAGDEHCLSASTPRCFGVLSR
eukprot:632717-Alexandrium_andersonii.AAC.1